MGKLWDDLREMLCTIHQWRIVLEGPGVGQRHVYKSPLKHGGGYPKEHKH